MPLLCFPNIKNKNIKKVVLIYGTIAGLIVSLMLFISFGLIMKWGTQPKLEHGELIGYTSMILAMSMIFFGVGIYRSRYLGGNITFLRAWGTGLLIALLASAFYVITWIILYKGFMPDFMDNYGNYMLRQAQASGQPAEEIARLQQQLEWGKKMYSTWPGLIGITFLEIFPVGFAMSLVSALVFSLLKKKRHTHPEA